jgi:hypothetical protein
MKCGYLEFMYISRTKYFLKCIDLNTSSNAAISCINEIVIYSKTSIDTESICTWQLWPLGSKTSTTLPLIDLSP